MEIQEQTLRDTVATSIKTYFSQLDGQPARNVYEMVLSEIEEPLLRSVLAHCRGNQSKAAIYLGLSRGTLRKKLKQYDLI